MPQEIHTIPKLKKENPLQEIGNDYTQDDLEKEIEEILIRETRIRDVSVIGIPDEHYGETICACIIPKPGKTPTNDEFLRYLETRIASYKIPSRVVMLTEFPLNSMGKIRKDILRERVLNLNVSESDSAD